MQLPCRHVLAIRERMGLSLYSEDGIADRWKTSYMQQVFDNKCSSDAIMADKSYQVKSLTNMHENIGIIYRQQLSNQNLQDGYLLNIRSFTKLNI